MFIVIGKTFKSVEDLIKALEDGKSVSIFAYNIRWECYLAPLTLKRFDECQATNTIDLSEDGLKCIFLEPKVVSEDTPIKLAKGEYQLATVDKLQEKFEGDIYR